MNKYYQKHKEKFRKEARKRYQNFSEKDTEKRQKKGLRKISKFYCRRKKGPSIINTVSRSKNYYLTHEK